MEQWIIRSRRPRNHRQRRHLVQLPISSKWKEKMEGSSEENIYEIVLRLFFSPLILVFIASTLERPIHIKSINYKKIRRTTFVSVQRTIPELDHGQTCIHSPRPKHHPMHWKVSHHFLPISSLIDLLAPNINEITSTSCVFNWQAHKPLGTDPITYILQLQIYRKENDYTEIYHGHLTSYRATNLEAGVEYRARVCAIRSTSEGFTLNSPFSSATHFVLPRPEDLAAALSASRTSKHHSSFDHHHSETKFSLVNHYRSLFHRKFRSLQIFESRTLTDQQWAIVIFVAFTLLALFIAIFANFMYSKYNNASSISVDNAFSSASSSSSFSPGLKK